MSLFTDIASMFNGEVPEGERKKRMNGANDQTPDEKKLAEFIRKKVEEVRSSGNRIAHEGQWMTNIAYLLGFDSVYYDTTNRQFRTIDGSGRVGLRRNRTFENLILPAVQNRQARLCKKEPEWEIRPKDNSNEAKEAARLAKDVGVQLWEECGMGMNRQQLTMWLQECGHSYLKVGFDDELGEELLDPEGNFMGYEGKVRVDTCSAFEVFPDPLAKTLEECQWLIHAKVRKLDYFRSHYDRGYLVKEEGAWLLSIQYEQRIQSLTNTGMANANSVYNMENAAIELSYYEKRSRKHPQGRHVIVANGVILKDGPLPVGEIPFAKFDDVLIAGKYYSEATITHARPLQDQYNRTLTRRSKWANQLLAGKWIAARGHGIAQEGLDDTEEVVEYDPVPNAPPPSAMQVPVIPPYAYTESQDNKKSLNEIFGLSDIARGQLPAAGIPAVGMQLLLEQDETRIGIEVAQHEEAYARVIQLMLMHEAKFAKTDRNLITKNQNNDFYIRKYRGEDLPLKPEVRVVKGSTIPTSLSMRRQEILNTLSLGLLGNPQDPKVQEKVLGMLEFGDTEGLWQDSALDEAQAKREIESIEMGMQPPINKFDNHPFLIKKLNDYRKSDKFQELELPKQQLLEMVMEAHAKMLANLMNPQLATMKQNVADGFTPDGKPLMQRLQNPAAAMGVAPAGGMPQNNVQPALAANGG